MPKAELRRLFPDVDDWRAEDSFGHESGFGGKVDLHSPSTGIVVDYKGKDAGLIGEIDGTICGGPGLRPKD